ncbi:TetR/AcrR family transcriptional regulator [Kitasatospora sp. NPDC006697]|uniref:TetR/AcrR family transcriptional regulator n=1 Tax=Kitasatospora sp. NPDC006697 TaxID=3364020 RepID=UPI00369108C4
MSELETAPVPSDQRLLRGARARQAIARHAADVASLEGLSGLSIGRLATDLQLSKSGIATLFGTKERLQLAAVAAAHEAFLDAVVRPTTAAAPGADRLRAITERWIEYICTPLFPGGCFWVANLADFDSRPGPVRDSLLRKHQDWLALIAGEFQSAVDQGQIPDTDVEVATFQLAAVLAAANTAVLIDDPRAGDKARKILESLLAPRTAA